MADPADVGGALTGQMDPAQAAGQWDDFLNRPGNRSALLQIGLGLMQPVGIGQSVGGHIAQAVGSGGEAVGRADAQDLKEQNADDKLAVANDRLRVAQQNADASTSRANTAATRASAKKVGGLTDLMKSRFAREDAHNFEKTLDSDAKDIVKQANDVLADPNSDIVKKYKGKTKDQIREELRASRPKPKYGSIPSNDDGDDNTSDSTNDTQQVEVPPIPNARKAADGNWYAPDPQRVGKYLLVK